MMVPPESSLVVFVMLSNDFLGGSLIWRLRCRKIASSSNTNFCHKKTICDSSQ